MSLLVPDRRIVRIPTIISPRRASANLQGFGQVRGPHRSPIPGILASAQMMAAAGGGGSNLEVALGGLNAPASGTTGTTVTISDLPFVPTFFFFWMVGRTETTDAAALSAASARASFGWSDGTSSYAWGSAQGHNGANSNNGFGHNTGVCLIRSGVQFNDGTWRGMSCTLTSDGCTLTITSTGNPFAWTAIRIHYLALGGSDLSVKAGTFSVSSGTGNQSFTPLSFLPVALMTAGAPYAIGTGFQNTPDYAIGAASGPSNMWTWGGQSSQNIATSDTNRYLRTDEMSAFLDSSGVGCGSRLRHVSMDATGWTVNRLESTGFTLPYAAFGGIVAKVGTFTADAGGGSITGVGATPKAVLLLTHGTTQSTADTTQADNMFSIGAVVAGPSQLCAHMRDIDNVGSGKVMTGHRDDSVIMTADSTPSVSSRIAISSLDSDGFTYTMPTSTLNGYLVGYLALG